MSTLDVASSRTRILDDRRIARARQSSCFCPTENTSEVSEVYVYN